jgi:uncharacterized repeat protein (TIGR03803 family)
MTAIAAPAQTFKTLQSFNSTDGANPYAGLVQATNGNLYGTTYGGGPVGAGTVFKMTPTGTLTTLYSFCSQSGCTDGLGVIAGLVQATNGNLYGTTINDGANGAGGTIFKITPGGTLTTLYSFCSQSGCTDGATPPAGLIQATDGNFYGTTFTGGANNDGTVFKITPSGRLATLHSFDGTDGANPWAGLMQGTDGNFYGTTSAGGANSNGMCGSIGCGTIFKITPGGTLTTLYSFCSQSGCADGDTPYAGLIQATDGNFYGTTLDGGSMITNAGTVFKITPGRVLTTLYTFCPQSPCTDGESPWAPLIQATDGNLYGTTYSGGANLNEGMVFKITLGGTLTTLHSFDGTDGANPQGGLVQDTNGKLYGTTYQGGANSVGAVFSLAVGLGPFVETNPTSGKVGATVKILGTNLTGATSVTFNGTAATFTVKSPSLITTTVPTGATTGTVQVVTPSHTLNSNVPFRVLP